VRFCTLSFATAELEGPFAVLSPDGHGSGSTFPVVYDNAKLNAFYTQIVDMAAPLISLPRGKNLPGDQIRAYMEQLSILVAMHAIRAAIFFKHEGYVGEREYRFFQIFRADVPPPSVKTRGPKNISYREFNWRGPSMPLKQIMVGPAADFASAKDAVQAMLHRARITGVAIVPSKIPYRSTAARDKKPAKLWFWILAAMIVVGGALAARLL